MKHVKISESDNPSKERIWDKMYQCRDFELSHFWQKAAFLFGSLTMCFGGYGALVLQVVDKDTNSVWLPYIYQYMCGISLLGIVLSVVWIYMMKGSKAWYEVYEKSIYAIEREIFQDNQQYVEGEFAKRMRGDFTKAFIGFDGGAFSPSKINILIGWIILIVWGFWGFFSLYNLNFDVIDKPEIQKLCVYLGIIVVLSVLTPIIIKPFITSSPLLRKKDRGYVWKFCMHLIKYCILFGEFLLFMSLTYSTLGIIILIVFVISLLYRWIVPYYKQYVVEELKRSAKKEEEQCIYDKVNDYLSENLRERVANSKVKKKGINQDVDKQIDNTINNLINDTVDDNINLIINKYLDTEVAKRVNIKLNEILKERMNDIGNKILTTTSPSVNKYVN